MTSLRLIALAGFAGMALSACVENADNGPPPLPGPENDTCGARAVAHLIGQDSAALATIGTRRDPMRVLSPGQPMTMDYIESRLNVELDAAGRIIRLGCG